MMWNKDKFVVLSPESYIFVDQYKFLENFSWFELDSRNPRKLAPHENYQPYGSLAWPDPIPRRGVIAFSISGALILHESNNAPARNRVWPRETSFEAASNRVYRDKQTSGNKLLNIGFDSSTQNDLWRIHGFV